MDGSRAPAREYTHVCAIDDIPPLGARVLPGAAADGGDVAVFRGEGDRIFALVDRCPHKGGPLSQGIVFGEHVACPLHNWTIELDTGCAVAPDTGCTASFPVRIAGRAISVALDGE